jgi:hypothetical protein
MKLTARPRQFLRRRAGSAFLLLALSAGSAAALDRVGIETPLVSPADPEHRDCTQALLHRAAILAGRDHGRRVEVIPPASRAAGGYRLSVVAVYGDNPVVALTLRPSRPGGEERRLVVG